MKKKHTSEGQPDLSKIGDDDDVIVTGTSYADATRKYTADSGDNTNITLIGKNVRLSNSDKLSKGSKIRNQYNQVLHLTQDTNGKVTNSQ